jgi:WD40 repeat protein
MTARSLLALRTACCTLLVAALTYACDSSTEPGSRGVRVVSGGSQTDTVFAVLAQPLVVEIRDSTGRLASGVTVRFQSLLNSNGNSVLVWKADQQKWDIFTTAVVDAKGRASTRMKVMAEAGTMRLQIGVPEWGIADTVTFTSTPGAPQRWTISPYDTAMRSGTSFTLKAIVGDQFTNPVPGAVPTFTATGVSVSPTGQVTTTTAPSRAKIVVSYKTMKDSVSVSVLPRLAMVINRSDAVSAAVVSINSDGTGSTTLATTTDRSIAPSSVASTPSVVYYRGTASSTGKVWVVQPNGTPQLLLPGQARAESWPTLSPDGTWVYFVRDARSLWRVHLDGSGLDSLTSFKQARTYMAPTVSPDGVSVAIEDSIGGVKIVDVATKAARTTGFPCAAPRYSPDGTSFACVSPTDVSITRIDGTNQKIIASMAPYPVSDPLSGVDWTPDGKWLVVAVANGTARLFEISSGAVIDLTDVLGRNLIQVSFVR